MGDRFVSLSHERVRILTLILLAYSLLLAGCSEVLGSSLSVLKYLGLAVGAAVALIFSLRSHISMRKFVPCFIALVVLVAETLVQTGEFSAFEAIGLYVLVFIYAVFSPMLLTSVRELRIVAIAVALLTVVLFALSIGPSLEQYRMYAGFGRPRLGGPYGNPNSLGGISVINTIMLLISVFADRKNCGMPTYISLVVMAVCLVLSGSITSFLTLAAFLATTIYFSVKTRLQTGAGRALASMAFMLAMAVIVYLAFQEFSSYETFAVRFDTVTKIDVESEHALFGIGYVSSRDVDAITELAGGPTEMLLASLFYRVGIVGIAAYALMFIGALQREDEPPGSSNPLLNGCVAALLTQTFGESFLSSVMVFPSCFGWILLSSVSLAMLGRSGAQAAENNSAVQGEEDHAHMLGE